jgi:phage protein D
MKEITYTLHVDGEPAERRLLERLQRIEVEEHVDMADMLRLEFATSVRDDESGWSLVDDEIFEPFTALRFGLQAGSRSPDLVLNAYVIDVDVSFSNAPGQSTLEVVAMDHTALMDREEKRRRWKDMRHSAIARDIFDEYNLAGRAGTTVKKTEPGGQELEAPVMQRGTDARFLRQLADQNGYLFYVETHPDSGQEEGHFHPLEREETSLDMEAQAPLRVSMGRTTNVDSFDVRYEMTKPFEAVGAGVKADSRDKQEASSDSSTGSSHGKKSTLQGKKRKKFIPPASGQRTGDIQTYGQVLSNRSSYAIRATGRLRIVEYENVLRAKRPVQVEGAGDKFSVRYYVEQVQHTITDEEYIQNFTLRTNAEGARQNQPLTPRR